MDRKSRFDLLNEKNDRRPRRICKSCGRALASSHIGDICQSCKEDAIYREVKQYVSENDVGEYDVAQKFDIPVETVRKWVQLGYMEYKTNK